MSNIGITQQHFADPSAGYPRAFGKEARIPVNTGLTRAKVYDVASAEDIKHFLSATLSALSKENPLRQNYAEDPTALLAHVFGEQGSYNVSGCLATLRQQQDPTPEQKILRRTLALMSFNGLDPNSIAKMDALQTYDDLQVTDPDIRTKITNSGAGAFYIVSLMHDGERSVRFHIYPPPPKNSIIQDNNIHCHLGDSGSIVLSGELVNQLYRVEPTDGASPAHAIYKIDQRRDGKDGERRSVLMRQSGAEINLVSSFMYVAGEHYHVPDHDNVPQDDPELGSYHLVGNRNLTTTLFTVDISGLSDGKKSLTVLSGDSPEEVEEEYEIVETGFDGMTLDQVLDLADQQTRRELASISRVSTVLDREQTLG